MVGPHPTSNKVSLLSAGVVFRITSAKLGSRNRLIRVPWLIASKQRNDSQKMRTNVESALQEHNEDFTKNYLHYKTAPGKLGHRIHFRSLPAGRPALWSVRAWRNTVNAEWSGAAWGGGWFRGTMIELKSSRSSQTPFKKAAPPEEDLLIERRLLMKDFGDGRDDGKSRPPPILLFSVFA